MKFSILNGNNVLNGTAESWERFKHARADYFRRVEQAEKLGHPINPLLGHPDPVAREAE